MTFNLAERFRAISHEAATLQGAYIEVADAFATAISAERLDAETEVVHARLRAILADYAALVAERKRLIAEIRQHARDMRPL